ncbi:hypothetical protein J4H92_06990 [Leucobacter weissii]|uniref:Uncharacterized protein n=1 Tax=Leucobacter weissii TaxID=1983706 RepID=A0A939MIS6_9MICO|nr:hypothetical protein [Leucobacter weissii]
MFDALAQRRADAPLPASSEDPLPPDAAERDAARRQQANPVDETVSEEGFRFVTGGVRDHEKAAVIAVLSAVRAEETQRVRRIERREHEPWARSQRVPEGIGELLAGE